MTGKRRRKQLTADQYADGVLAGDTTVLARAITLVESTAAAHVALAAEVMERLLPRSGGAARVGITGAPGAGKSTLIECLGKRLTAAGHRVAVLAIDPSSTVTRGSILGDKTRMTELARDERAFIRPSPTAGSLGGVARKTRETILLCEAAGYDVVLVETVGVAQSEVATRALVDFFLLLLLPGAGDELQGLKKGVVELADVLVVTKADGDNRARAELSRQEYATAVHYLTPATEGWTVEVLTCSAVSGEGVDELWEAVQRHRGHGEQTGELDRRRSSQALEWMHSQIRQDLERAFFEDPRVAGLLPDLERRVREGELSPSAAARRALSAGAREVDPEG